jgi:hypothetical protein
VTPAIDYTWVYSRRKGKFGADIEMEPQIGDKLVFT